MATILAPLKMQREERTQEMRPPIDPHMIAAHRCSPQTGERTPRFMRTALDAFPELRRLETRIGDLSCVKNPSDSRDM
jgi:hypothetical protein